MTSDADDEALSWEGDDEKPAKPARLPRGWRAVGKGGDTVVQDGADSASGAPMSSGMLVAIGVFGGIYALYIVGWIVGGLNLRGLAGRFVADAFVTPWIALAALGTAAWLPAVWRLTTDRPSWIRILLLIVGAILLVPWPFVMLGVVS